MYKGKTMIEGTRLVCLLRGAPLSGCERNAFMYMQPSCMKEPVKVG